VIAIVLNVVSQSKQAALVSLIPKAKRSIALDAEKKKYDKLLTDTGIDLLWRKHPCRGTSCKDTKT